jgi:hypothetical protein
MALIGAPMIIAACVILAAKRTQARVEPPLALRAHWLDMNEDETWGIE